MRDIITILQSHFERLYFRKGYGSTITSFFMSLICIGFRGARKEQIEFYRDAAEASKTRRVSLISNYIANAGTSQTVEKINTSICNSVQAMRQMLYTTTQTLGKITPHQQQKLKKIILSYQITHIVRFYNMIKKNWIDSPKNHQCRSKYRRLKK